MGKTYDQEEKSLFLRQGKGVPDVSQFVLPFDSVCPNDGSRELFCQPIFIKTKKF